MNKMDPRVSKALAASGFMSPATFAKFIGLCDSFMINRIWNVMFGNGYIYIEEYVVEWLGFEGADNFISRKIFKAFLEILGLWKCALFLEYEGYEKLRNDAKSQAFPMDIVYPNHLAKSYLFLNADCWNKLMGSRTMSQRHSVKSEYANIVEACKLYEQYRKLRVKSIIHLYRQLIDTKSQLIEICSCLIKYERQ